MKQAPSPLSTTANNQPKRVSTPLAADYLGTGMRELKQLRKKRALPFYRLGHRTIVYAISDLDAFLASCRVEASARCPAAGAGVTK